MQHTAVSLLKMSWAPLNRWNFIPSYIVVSRSRCARLGDATMRYFSFENFPFKPVPFKVVICSLAAMRVKGMGEVVHEVSW
jgi:hypothetical protein